MPALVAIGDWFKAVDPAHVGSIGLVVAAAALVGFSVRRLAGPRLGGFPLGMLSAFAFTAALAYAGVRPAAEIVWVLLIILVIASILSLLSDA